MKTITLPEMKMGSIGGEFRLVLYNSDGSVERDTGWFSNRIVDRGLEMYGLIPTGDNNWYSWNVIGDSGIATDDNMTQLGNELARVGGSSVTSVQPVAPNYEFSSTRRYRYEATVGTGTIREVGMEATNAGGLFCRHVVSPEITKSDTQILDVYYKFTVWPGLTETTGQTTIDGIIYDWACSNYYLNNGNNADSSCFKCGAYPVVGYPYVHAWSGAKAGQLDINPSGTSWSGGAGVTGGRGEVLAGVPGVSSAGEFTFPITAGNGTDYFRTITFRTDALKIFRQCEFTQIAGQPNPGEGIPKDNTEEITFAFQHTWSRHT